MGIFDRIKNAIWGEAEAAEPLEVVALLRQDPLRRLVALVHELPHLLVDHLLGVRPGIHRAALRPEIFDAVVAAAKALRAGQ